MPLKQTFLQTSHAQIAVNQTDGKGLAVVLIHGNSARKEVFDTLLQSDLGDRYRLISVDLPGHGASGDAVAPDRTYSLPGYADALIEVVSLLGIDKAALFGWSLGGYVGLEMVPRFPGLVGLMVSGAPPVRPTTDSIMSAYRQSPIIELVGKPEFTADDAALFVAIAYGSAASEGLREAARRTDGRARALMFAGLFAGQFTDQLTTLETAKAPIAVVDGANDPFVNTDYVGQLPPAMFWERHYHLVRGAGHAPFLQAPDLFKPLLDRFLVDMEKRAAMVAPERAKTAAA
jgi:pimeloyl-ACP methyl ester carboxylesterase